jgi:hypothetical protein
MDDLLQYLLVGALALDYLHLVEMLYYPLVDLALEMMN